MLENGNFTFFCRTKTSFGMNALEHLPFDLSAMGSQKPLVIIDKQSQMNQCTKPLVRAFKESKMTLGICPFLDQTTDHPIEPGEKNDANEEIEIIKEFYQIYTTNGFDAIIALGTGRVADMAKALNIAVTLGPNTLKANPKISLPLAPFVYLPTGMGTGMETHTQARFNQNIFHSPFLAPDLAMIDPTILTDLDTENKNIAIPIINAGLTCLCVCCEAHVLSENPPARAYAATGIGLIMENLLPLVKQILAPPNRSDKKAIRDHQTRLTHAAVITGSLLANCNKLTCFQLGNRMAEDSTLSPGAAMAILLPTVLDMMAGNTDLGNLLQPLVGFDEFSRVPAPQRPGLSIQKIQFLLNELYQISLGTIPRTLDDTDLDHTKIQEWLQETLNQPQVKRA